MRRGARADVIPGMNLPAARLIAVVPFLMMSFSLAAQQPPKADLGLFEEHADVGGPAKAGSVAFDAAAKTYKIAGGGTNMWANADAFHFVWKKMSGDVSLAADAAFPTPGGDPHRKAVLIILIGLAVVTLVKAGLDLTHGA